MSIPEPGNTMARSGSAASPMSHSGARGLAIQAARASLAHHDLKGAAEALGPLMNRRKPGAEPLFLMASIHEMAGKLPRAMEFAKRSLALHEHPDTQLLIARCHRANGQTEACLALCERVLSRHPHSLAAHQLKGAALEEAGRIEEARAVIDPLMQTAKEQGRSAEPPIQFEWAKLLVQEKRYEEAVELMDNILGAGVQPDLKRVTLYLRAKACDRMKDYDGAYESAASANSIGKIEFDPDFYEEQIQMLVENWSLESMANFPLSSCDSAVPVFVAGMPRSGTSLIDQIIDAHPKAAGVGELATIEKFAIDLAGIWNPDKEPPQCFGRFDSFRWTRAARDYLKGVQKGAPEAERIVNKALGNNKLVGLIARLFSNTRIIHAIRDPRDVAISCFMGGFNNKLHSWTTQMDWSVRAWEQSMRMMEHWKKSLGVPILDVHYENLVRYPETEFPRIIKFLGLEWDDACNEFYKTRRTVRTLSYDQVNRPLYTSSVGRHASYAKFLEGIEFPFYDPGASMQSDRPG